MMHDATAPPIVVEMLAAKGLFFDRFIAKGSFSTVWAVHDANREGERFAAKVISTNVLRMYNIPLESLLSEIDIMHRLRHHRIVALDQVIPCNEDLLVIVMELVGGVELFQHVVKHGPMSESDVRVVISQLLDVLEYMHGEGVVHRDIKPENILFDAARKEVMLIDFGLGKVVSAEHSAKSFVGTPDYLAPEVDPLHRDDPEAGYTSAVDVWSLGMVMYVALAGRFPLRDRVDDSPLLASIEILATSRECQAFLTALLETDPLKRPTAAQARAHPWITGAASPPPPSGASGSSCGSAGAVGCSIKKECGGRYGNRQLACCTMRPLSIDGEADATCSRRGENKLLRMATLQHTVAERFYDAYEVRSSFLLFVRYILFC
jgi:serine/threonine protein kinase